MKYNTLKAAILAVIILSAVILPACASVNSSVLPIIAGDVQAISATTALAGMAKAMNGHVGTTILATTAGTKAVFAWGMGTGSGQWAYAWVDFSAARPFADIAKYGGTVMNTSDWSALSKSMKAEGWLEVNPRTILPQYNKAAVNSGGLVVTVVDDDVLR